MTVAIHRFNQKKYVLNISEDFREKIQKNV